MEENARSLSATTRGTISILIEYPSNGYLKVNVA